MREFVKSLHMSGDFWGGLAAMLVALPASIAFGVTIYSAIAPAHAALGALAGIVGATVIRLEIGRAHVWTPVQLESRMPASA